ncbi:Core histone macro-H2A.2 [Microtus ochrogaster]|uniref:Histone H2A n=1 Tax=Microtus ochrogaster TaxID=79684 RepID=A0A8J6FZQ8_MICOH|nr:Core histone macro-H2A.2 [Microtus ochrogaster]
MVGGGTAVDSGRAESTGSVRRNRGAGSKRWAPNYATAAIEYLAVEILELAGNAARGSKKAGLAPRHILLAVANDEKLNQALKGVTNPSGGVLLRIHPKLLPKKRGTKGKSEMILTPTTEKSRRKAINGVRVEDVVHRIPAEIILKEAIGKDLEMGGGKGGEFLETVVAQVTLKALSAHLDNSSVSSLKSLYFLLSGSESISPAKLYTK